ncbi:MAG: hypothetical protein RL756_1902 [Pseudomonadota bacterium]
MNTTRSATLIGIVYVLAACGGGGSGSDAAPVSTAPPPPTGLWVSGGATGSGLSAFRARAGALSTSATRSGADVGIAGPVTSAPSGGAGAAGGSGTGAGFSTTYTLEADVDEPDILKYDGELLVTAPTRSACCFILADVAVAPDAPSSATPEGPHISLFETDASAGQAERVGSIPLAADERVEGLYLTSGRLQALMSTAWWGVFGERLARPTLWQNQETRLSIYDVAIPATPARLSELRIEGALIASRRVGDEILLITQHTPVIAGLNPSPTTTADDSANAAVLAGITPAEILPRITRDGAPINVLGLDSCLRQDASHPLAVNTPATMSVVTLIAVNASNGNVIRASCLLEPVTGVYVSSDVIALTWVDYREATPFTYVHQLRLRDHAYQGSERVPGALYGGGNADFRISERQGVLRLVTTEFTQDPTDRFDHRLFTLRASNSAPELDLLATLPKDGEPELGKPNEDLYGVRFIDRRAYLVTFERTDPLYVIDLQNPAQPAIVGELEIPGFSDLLHPVSEALLLGIGGSGAGRAKVELFNIADPDAPQSAGVLELGADFDHSFSPAQYNRYAFTYLAGDSIDRFVVPYSAWRFRDDTFSSKDAFALFELAGKAQPESASVQQIGEVLLPPGEGTSGDVRSVIAGDALYLWTAQSLLTGFWSNPETVTPVR